MADTERRPGEGEADAEGVLRVVRFFDSLLEERAGLEELLAAAAEVAGCPCGVRAADPLVGFSVDAGGRVGSSEPPPGRVLRPLPAGAEVWLARSGPAWPLDGLVLERLAAVCSVVLDRLATRLPGLGDPGLLELLIGEDAGVVDRARAAQLLGFHSTDELQLLAVAGPEGAWEAVAEQLPDHRGRLRTTDLGKIRAMVTTGAVPEELRAPHHVRIGVGRRLPALEAPRSWAGAAAALRFARTYAPGAGGPAIARNPVIFSKDLGGYLLLARHLDTACLDEVEDLAVLDGMAADPALAEVLTTLHVLCFSGTVRATARELHLHHNSVRHQIAKAETLLGFRVTEPMGQHRLLLSLALRRLRDVATGE